MANNERKREKRTRVSTELDLNKPPYTFVKKLTASDIDHHLSRLMLDTRDVESHILSHLSTDNQRTIQEGNGVKVKVYDDDTDTEHDLILKRMIKSSRSYVLNAGWVTQFVKRRDLKERYELGLLWNSFDYRLHICVLSPTPADPKNPK